jgi:hypothetical protein
MPNGHLAGLSLSHRLLAFAHPHHPPRCNARRIMERQPRKIWWHFKLWSEESLFHWLFKTYWRRKREIPLLLSQPENSHLKLIHFKHPRETEVWLNEFSKVQS